MFAASAPTLLSVGLAAELHGRASVALVAAAFTVGSLTAPLIAFHVQRRRANGPTVWLLCALGMTLGWVLAPWSVVLMMVAQMASGLCMTALEGLLDTSIAARAGAGVTGALARSTAGRALGSAAAVALLPDAVGQVGLTTSVAFVAGVLGVALLVVRRRERTSEPPPSRRERTSGPRRVGANARLNPAESARTHVFAGCPGWDSNPHWMVFETTASAIGLPGRTAPQGSRPGPGTSWAAGSNPCHCLVTE